MMQIKWEGDYMPTPEQEAQCVAAIRDLELGAAEDLIFHDEWLVGEPNDANHVSAILWGVVGSDVIRGEIHRAAEGASP